MTNILIVAGVMATQFQLVQINPAGFGDALSSVRQKAGPGPLRVLVLSNDRGEGALVVAVADSDQKRQDVVIRASKLLMLASWHANKKEMLFSDSGAVAGKIERLGIRFIIVDRTQKMTEEMNLLMGKVVNDQPYRFPMVADLPVESHRSRHLQVYRVLRAAEPPLEALEFRLPFSSTIVGGMQFKQ